MRLTIHAFTMTIVLFIGSPAFVFGQQTQNSWSDGNPTFQRIVTDSIVNLSVGATASLTPTLRVRDLTNSQFFLQGTIVHYNSNQPGLGSFQNYAVPQDFKIGPGTDVYLIADAFSNRVAAINAATGSEITTFGGAPNTPEEIERPVHMQFYQVDQDKRILLVTDETGAKVMVFDYDSHALDWSFNIGLSQPAAAVLDANDNVIIADKNNNRVIVVDRLTNTIISNSSTSGLSLNLPVDVDFANGEILITDNANHRVLIVNASDFSIIASFGETGVAGSDDSHLDSPLDAQLLPSGNILITDTGNNRIIEVNRSGEIVWRFLPEFEDLTSVQRLADSRMLVVNDNEVSIKGYQTAIYEFDEIALRQESSFDSLSWSEFVPAGTQVEYQVRVAEDEGDIIGASWTGPDSSSWFTAENFSLANIRKGTQFIQARTRLTTADPLVTPIIENLQLHYHFYDTGTDGRLLSSTIEDSAGRTILNWKNFKYRITPAQINLRSEIKLDINIIDATTGQVLETILSTNTDTLETKANLPTLRGVQHIQLQAVFGTNNPSVTPELRDWSISWESTVSSDASISFTDANRDTIEVVRVTDTPTNLIFVSMTDQNLRDILETVTVNLRATVSGDEETLELTRLSGTTTYFPNTGLRAFLSEEVDQGNAILEFSPRDQLIVTYTDPTDGEDFVSDTVVVLQRSRAQLRVEDQFGVLENNAIVQFTDRLNFFVTGETDHDITEAQDRITLNVRVPSTGDIESVVLLEEANADNPDIFSTGNFNNTNGLSITNNAISSLNDGLIQISSANQFVAEYIDVDTASVPLRMENTEGPGGPNIPDDPFGFQLAPNPFRSNSGDIMRIRFYANEGTLNVEKIDIYNLAGEPVRTLQASGMSLGAGTTIGMGSVSVSASAWWDFEDRYGNQVSSGTYFAQMSGRFTDNLGQTESVTYLKKFVIVR